MGLGVLEVSVEGPGEGVSGVIWVSAHTVRVLELAVLTSVGAGASVYFSAAQGAQQVGATLGAVNP